jgi:CMP-N-acetylneuraminic acid synthetase
VRTLGLITARGGSKGIPGKNLKLLAGKPLIAHTIESARQSGAFDRLILSTDEEAIAGVARRLDCEVPFLRPADLARDETPHLPVVQHATEWLADHEAYRPDAVMILQPTSPLRQAHHIREAIERLESDDAESLVSVSEVPLHYHPLRAVRIDPSGDACLFVTGDPIRRRVNRRQDLPPVWMLNGAIYLLRSHVLSASEPSLYGDRTLAYPMPSPYGISIDTFEDWHEAERWLASLETRAAGLGQI